MKAFLTKTVVSLALMTSVALDWGRRERRSLIGARLMTGSAGPCI